MKGVGRIKESRGETAAKTLYYGKKPRGDKGVQEKEKSLSSSGPWKPDLNGPEGRQSAKEGERKKEAT